MFQQLLANKHHRLRDSVSIIIWPSGGLGLVTDKKKNNKKINPVQSKNRARPMAAQLKIIIINPVQSKNHARPMATRLTKEIVNTSTAIILKVCIFDRRRSEVN